VGCGTGRFSEVLARIGADLTIADLAPAMLSVTVERLKREGLESRLRAAECASIYQLPFDDDSFDCAFMLNVVGHLRDTQLALNEISRVLRPNGTLLVNFPNLYSIYFPAGARVNRQAKAVGQDVYSRWFRPCDMTSALAAAGLSIVDWYGHVHVPRSLHTNRWVAAMIGSLDCASRHTWLRHLAPVRFCLCRKSETTQ
jgi:2-polyprenyl-3-methyl-5-hydroxy-6-metoxy-1,4-benzoquinol methylase